MIHAVLPSPQNFLGLWISTYSKNDQPDIDKKQTVN